MEDLVSAMHNFVDFEERHSWIHRLYPLFLEYKKLDPETRKAVVRQAKSIANVTPTTLQRSFSAFAFLEKIDVDVVALKQGVTLMGLEAAAKAIIIDQDRGQELLQLVIHRKLRSREADQMFRSLLIERGHLVDNEVSSTGKPLLRRGGVPAERGALATTSELTKISKRNSKVAVATGPTQINRSISKNDLVHSEKGLEYRQALDWMAQSVYTAHGGREGIEIDHAVDRNNLRNKISSDFDAVAELRHQKTKLSALLYLDVSVHETREAHFEFLNTLATKLLENQSVYAAFSSIPAHLKRPIARLKAAKPSNFFVLEVSITFNNISAD